MLAEEADEIQLRWHLPAMPVPPREVIRHMRDPPGLADEGDEVQLRGTLMPLPGNG